MDNSLPHQETLARMYELRAMLDDGAEIAAMRLPQITGGLYDCADCGLIATRFYGRVEVCYACAVARLRVAKALLEGK